MNYKVHALSDVQTEHIGEGTMIWQFCVVLRGAKIGRYCNINCNVFIENAVTVGDNVTIKPGVQLWDGVEIEDCVFVGPNVTFTNDLSPRSKSNDWKLLTTKIEHGASIGANSTLVAGITVGRYALVGAGSVVTKSIGSHEVWFGNPATHRGYVTATGELLDLHMHSKETGQKIHLDLAV